jgi:hypothetical protein
VTRFENHSSRKKLSENRLWTPPTESEDYAIHEVEDYELKVNLTLRSPTDVLRRKGGALLLPL